MAYLYRHIRLDTNEPFYIGIGSDTNYSRANDRTGRTKYWKNIVSKVGYKIDILFDNITWEKACKKEIKFIKLYGRLDLKTGILINMTDGGDGCLGRIVTKEVRDKIAILVKKNSHWKDGRKHTPESIEKIRIARINMNRTGIGEKISKGKLGKIQSNWKKIINIDTKEIFNNIVIASKSINITSSCLSKQLRGTVKNKTNLKYYII